MRNFLYILCASSLFAFSANADMHPVSYQSTTGGVWTEASTWNSINPDKSYPQNNASSFSIQGSDKTLTLNSDVTVGRLVGGGGGFTGWTVEGTGKISFDSLYDSQADWSNPAYGYCASALWGAGSITFNNTGGIVYDSSDTSESWSDTTGVYIFRSMKVASAISQTYNTDVTALVATSMLGASTANSVLNFNSTTKLTTFLIATGTANFNGTSLFSNITVNSDGVANMGGLAVNGSIDGVDYANNITSKGTLNFVGDYSSATTFSNYGVITNHLKLNFNQVGKIITEYHKYTDNSVVNIAKDAIIKFATDKAPGDSWGTKYLIEVGGKSYVTIAGTLDALDFAGSTSSTQLLRVWGNVTLDSTAKILASGKATNNLYLGRQSTFTINGEATVSGIKYMQACQQKTSSAKITINNSKTLKDMVLAISKDIYGGDGTTADTLTNTDVILIGDCAIGKIAFWDANNQVTFDLTDCTSLVLNTLYDGSNSKNGRIAFDGFKSGIVYIENTSGIDADYFKQYVTSEGWNLSLENGYIIGTQVPEPAACAAILAALAIGFAAYRRRK